MRIGIECSALDHPHKSGVGYYLQNLIREAAKQMPADLFFFCHLSCKSRPAVPLEVEAHNTRTRRILFPSKLYKLSEFWLPLIPFDLLARTKADVFFFPNFGRFPLMLCKKSVVVIHDLGFLESPANVPPSLRRYLNLVVPRSLQKADRVVANSENTRKEITRKYGTDPRKISVITPALDHDLYRRSGAQDIERVKRKFGIAKDYLLFLGTIEPRKNIAGIIRAYRSLPGDLRKRYQLVLAGGKGWLDEEINQLANSLDRRELVRTGYIEERDKPALYSGAMLFLYPSHYEGFGMPVIEAMACGAPVIAAENSGLVEAGGKAARYIQAGNDGMLSELIRKLIAEPGELGALREAGFRRAQSFSWRSEAAKLVEIFKNLS